ncbi:MAG: hypothetical protein ACRDRK_13725 [Pseudonocardia sp.]
MAGEVEGERDRARWRGAAAGALHRPAGVVAHGGQQSGQGGVLGAPLGEPDVVLGHRAAVTPLERGRAADDQLAGLGQLRLQSAVVGLVGDERRAGQAGVALVAGLQRRK